MKSEDKYNYGLAILRVLMTFVVVLCHFWFVTDYEGLSIGLLILSKLKGFAVPTFMLLSFYLFESKMKKGFRYTIERLKRLVIPYAVWPLIYYAVIILVYSENNLCISSLLWQILLGSSEELSPQFWYQCVLIWFTLFTLLLFNMLPTKYVYHILIILTFFALFAQYSGINYFLFGRFGYEQRYTLGRVAETFPLVILGLYISKAKVIQRLQHYRIYAIVAIGMYILLGMKYELFSHPVYQFGYAGIECLFIPFLMLIAFAIIPTTKIPHVIKHIIYLGAKYSFGVYCLHFLVGKIMNLVYARHNMPINQFSECIWIWLICYVLSWCISKIPSKLCKMLVT